MVEGLRPENVWAIPKDFRFPPEEIVRLMCRQAGITTFTVLEPLSHLREYEWAIQHAIEDCRTAGGDAQILQRASVLMRITVNGQTSDRHIRIVVFPPKEEHAADGDS